MGFRCCDGDASVGVASSARRSSSIGAERRAAVVMRVVVDGDDVGFGNVAILLFVEDGANAKVFVGEMAAERRNAPERRKTVENLMMPGQVSYLQ